MNWRELVGQSTVQYSAVFNGKNREKERKKERKKNQCSASVLVKKLCLRLRYRILVMSCLSMHSTAKHSDTGISLPPDCVFSLSITVQDKGLFFSPLLFN